jgi:predicted MFS family arabinose efflux permease
LPTPSGSRENENTTPLDYSDTHPFFPMLSRPLKVGCFAIEALNSFATVYYFYYFYFMMKTQFGFGNKANLVLAALNGATYALASWWGGRCAQRYGYARTLKWGLATMAAAMLVGLLLTSAAGQIAVFVVAVVGMSLTWPTLEALVSEGETGVRLQEMVGIYNVVWASTAAIGSFLGGAMLDKLGLASLFYIPMAIQIVQLALTVWVERNIPRTTSVRCAGAAAVGPAAAALAGSHPASTGVGRPSPAVLPPETSRPHRPRVKAFVRMAWLANPFAYIGINTLIAVIPGVAERLHLSTTQAGFFCSVWCFARLGAFTVLWKWAAWHYRFRWLLAAYLALVISFVAILTAPNLLVLVLAQCLFGTGIGLIYYSSLFYSMDNSDTKGEHGGIHEAVIGLGNFAGPAVGALALQLLPKYSHSGAVAVGLLLVCGLGGLLAIWRLDRSSDS